MHVRSAGPSADGRGRDSRDSGASRLRAVASMISCPYLRMTGAGSPRTSWRRSTDLTGSRARHHQLAERRHRARGETARTREAGRPCIRIEAVTVPAGEGGELLGRPPRGAAVRQIRLEPRLYRQQIPNVVGGVVGQVRRERTRVPPCERHRLAEAHVHELPDEGIQRERIGATGEGSGDLRIEHIRGRPVEMTNHRLQILLAGVNDRLHLGVGDELPDRRRIHVRHEIDQRHALPGRDLDEGNARVVRLLADELRVVREDPGRPDRFGELVQGVVRRDDGGRVLGNQGMIRDLRGRVGQRVSGVVALAASRRATPPSA